MNKTSQKQLSKIISNLENEGEALEALKEISETELEKKQEAFDNRSEKWQESDKGEEFQEVITQLEEDISNFEDAINELDSCISSLGQFELE